jgi:hypothetical protein
MNAPIPTAAEAGAGIAWFASQAGLLATVLALVALALATAYVWERIRCGKEMQMAWDRITEISKARTDDGIAVAKALSDSAVALAKVATLVESIDRRGR